MEGSNRRSGAVVAGKNGVQTLNVRMQALLGLMDNEERLKKWRDIAVDKGPELMGDLFCPRAKWATFLFITIISGTQPADAFKIRIARIFTHSPRPVKSPSEIIASFLSTASEELLRDADAKANLVTGAWVVCANVTIVMLVVWIIDLGWEWIIMLHCVCVCVAQTNLSLSRKALHLVFRLAIHIHLFFLGTEAPTLLCHSLLHVMGSVFVTAFYVRESLPMDVGMILSFGSVICLYTPWWFAACLAWGINAYIITDSRSLNDICQGMLGGLCGDDREIRPMIAVMILSVGSLICFKTSAGSGLFVALAILVRFADPCDVKDKQQIGWCLIAGVVVVRFVAHVSGGGFCGALLVVLSPILVLCHYSSELDVQAGMERPLPLLMCALVSFLWAPRNWVGVLCLTLAPLCKVLKTAPDVDAAKAMIIGWSVPFAALHLVSFAFTPNFTVVAMCLLGSYFSYGCIL